MQRINCHMEHKHNKIGFANKHCSSIYIGVIEPNQLIALLSDFKTLLLMFLIFFYIPLRVISVKFIELLTMACHLKYLYYLGCHSQMFKLKQSLGLRASSAGTRCALVSQHPCWVTQLSVTIALQLPVSTPGLAGHSHSQPQTMYK